MSQNLNMYSVLQPKQANFAQSQRYTVCNYFFNEVKVVKFTVKVKTSDQFH